MQRRAPDGEGGAGAGKDAAAAVAAAAAAVRAVDEALADQTQALTLDSFWKARTVSLGDASMHDSLTWTSSFFIFVATCLPAVGCVLLFSAMGYGDSVFRSLDSHYETSSGLLSMAVMLLLLLYLADFSYWQQYWQVRLPFARPQRVDPEIPRRSCAPPPPPPPLTASPTALAILLLSHHPLRVLRALRTAPSTPPRTQGIKDCLLLVVAAGLIIGALMSARNYPALPLSLFICGELFWFWCLKSLYPTPPKPLPGEPDVRPRYRASDFLYNVAWSLLISSLCLIAYWTVWWKVNDNFWNDSVSQRYAKLMGCTEHTKCLAGYLLWFAPFVFAVTSFVFSVVLFCLSRSLQKSHSSFYALRIFGLLWFCILVGMWIAAAVAGAAMKLSDAVQHFMLLTMCMLAVVVGSTVGWGKIKADIMKVPLLKKMAASIYSDWIKALLILTSTPLMALYFLISMVNRAVRVRLHFAKSTTAEERSYWLTQVAHDQWEGMRSWRWASVLVKAMYWGIILIGVNVGLGKGVNLFLAWLNGYLSDFSLQAVCVIFVAIGLLMFLLPPVPGLPVYISGGIIITKAAEPSMGFWGALMFSSFLSFLIKLPLAITIQQKCIGEYMGDSVEVKRLVGINSITIRAIDKILRRPGFDLGKICILSGGPDWPTAVLCGILRLRWIEVIMSSMPVYFVVMPCVMAAGFLLKKGDPWESVSAVMLTLAALVQVVAMVAALHFIEETATKHYDELSAIPKDEDVEKLEAKSRDRYQWYIAYTDWHSPHFPFWVKCLLVLGTVLTMFYFYLNQLYSQVCWESFQVSDSIADKLDGNAANIIKYWGYVSLYLLISSIVLLQIFNHWARDSNLDDFRSGKSQAWLREHHPEMFRDYVEEAIQEKEEELKVLRRRHTIKLEAARALVLADRRMTKTLKTFRKQSLLHGGIQRAGGVSAPFSDRVSEGSEESSGSDASSESDENYDIYHGQERPRLEDLSASLGGTRPVVMDIVRRRSETPPAEAVDGPQESEDTGRGAASESRHSRKDQGRSQARNGASHGNSSRSVPQQAVRRFDGEGSGSDAEEDRAEDASQGSVSASVGESGDEEGWDEGDHPNPEELWDEAVDQSSGRTYYYNKVSSEGPSLLPLPARLTCLATPLFSCFACRSRTKPVGTTRIACRHRSRRSQLMMQLPWRLSWLLWV